MWTHSLLFALGMGAAFTVQARVGDATCVRGAAVSVQYGGQWYAAKVLDGPDKMGTCLVSYDGYGSSWDEWVSLKRMRAPAAQAAPSGKASVAETPRHRGVGIPPGKYSCYTFDNGQLNYSYTDVIIAAGQRYRVGKQQGSYSLSSSGAIGFTGTLANATGKYAVKRGGKPQIDLVFNGDNRASMACSRRNT